MVEIVMAFDAPGGEECVCGDEIRDQEGCRQVWRFGVYWGERAKPEGCEEGHFKLLVRGEGKGRQLGEEYKEYVK